MSNFNLVMISAGFEHGGNVTHRHFDGHKGLLVYPFESQLGNRDFNDFLSSVERVQYRYPEFHEGLEPEELYEQIIDEELKTFLRKRNGSKFREVDLVMDENNRKKHFINRLKGNETIKRRDVIEAFFKSTFEAWENYYVNPNENMTYVGYSPAIGIDSRRMVKDFPNIKIIHIVRNPLSAYRDTKRRPFPQTIDRYTITWNIYHSTVNMYEKMYPNNVKIFRYEDLVEDKEKFMKEACAFIGIDFDEALLYPSWNGKKIEKDIAPWGTVLSSTKDYNKRIINDLSSEEIKQIVNGTVPLARYFGYDKIDYLSKYYAE